MAKVVRLSHSQMLEERDAAAALAAQFAHFPPHLLPPQLRAQVLRELGRVANPDEPIWPGGYVMLSKVQAVAVWDAIWTLPNIARRNQVHRTFDLISTFVEENTGEVLMTRRELADRIGTAPCHISNIMATLKQLGVISRSERRRIPGKQGPGEVVYFVNPHVAWNGSLTVRKEMAAKVPPPYLSLVKKDVTQP